MTTTILASFPSPAQGVWHLGPVPIRAYAVCIIVGIIAALMIGDRRWAARGGERGVIYDIALWAVPFGLVGGRLYHVLTDWKTYLGPGGAGPVAALRIWDGGLGIWGAVALGGVGAWIACRRRGIPLPAFGDAVAPGIVLAQAIGRLGNYFNQELYGRETTVPWGMEIFYRQEGEGPTAIIDVHSLNGVSTGQVAAIVHPTFLYELLWNLLVFVVLILVDRKFKIGHGRLFALYVALYCVGRFGVELLRDDVATHIAGIRINSFTATFVFLGAVVYIILAKKGREDPQTLGGHPDEREEHVPELARELAEVAAGTGVVAAATVAGREDVDPDESDTLDVLDTVEELETGDEFEALDEDEAEDALVDLVGESTVDEVIEEGSEPDVEDAADGQSTDIAAVVESDVEDADADEAEVEAEGAVESGVEDAGAEASEPDEAEVEAGDSEAGPATGDEVDDTAISEADDSEADGADEAEPATGEPQSEPVEDEVIEAVTADDADESDESDVVSADVVVEEIAEPSAPVLSGDADDSPAEAEDEFIVEAEVAAPDVEIETSADLEDDLIDEDHDPIDEDDIEGLSEAAVISNPVSEQQEAFDTVETADDEPHSSLGIVSSSDETTDPSAATVYAGDVESGDTTDDASAPDESEPAAVVDEVDGASESVTEVEPVESEVEPVESGTEVVVESEDSDGADESVDEEADGAQAVAPDTNEPVPSPRRWGLFRRRR